MDSKKSEKKYKNSTRNKKGNSISNALSWLRKSFKNDSDIEADKNTDHSDNIKFVWGFILVCLSLWILLALILHFFTGDDNISHSNNLFGKIGFYISHWLIDNTFGIASILIPFLILDRLIFF